VARTEIGIFVPSIFDRLTDEAPVSDRSQVARVGARSDDRGTRRGNVAQFAAHRKSRRRAPELRQSVYDYGLIDTTGIPVGTKMGRSASAGCGRHPIRAAYWIRRCSRRRWVRSQMRFMIRATLVMDREREHVIFDTLLEVASSE
jgi:predicted component of type VI protein secretion system